MAADIQQQYLISWMAFKIFILKTDSIFDKIWETVPHKVKESINYKKIQNERWHLALKGLNTWNLEN